MTTPPPDPEEYTAGRTAAYRDAESAPLEEVIRRWSEEGEKTYPGGIDGVAMVPVADLWPHREYDWSAEHHRGGGVPVGPYGSKWVTVPGMYHGERSDERVRDRTDKGWREFTEEEWAEGTWWDRTKAYMAEHGWMKSDPAHFEIGPDGSAKLGEGNHRLALAHELGIEEVPIRYHFHYDPVTLDENSFRHEAPEPEPEAEAAPEATIEEKAPVDDALVDELLKLLGRRGKFDLRAAALRHVTRASAGFPSGGQYGGLRTGGGFTAAWAQTDEPTCPDCEVLIGGQWRTGVCDECKHLMRGDEDEDGPDEDCEVCDGTGHPVCCRCEGTGIDPDPDFEDRDAMPLTDEADFGNDWKGTDELRGGRLDQSQPRPPDEEEALYGR